MDVRLSNRIAAALLITVIAISCVLTFGWTDDSVAEEIHGGDCGPKLHWKLDSAGEITIYGEGNMDFSESGGKAPWEEYKEGITKVTIESGVTSIADGAFDGCTSIFEVINLSSLEIKKGAENNGRVAYYARNVFTSKDDTTMGTLDSYVYGFYDNNAYLVKFIGEGTILELPEDLQDGEFIICKAFYTSSNVTLMTVPNGIISIEEGAFGDLIFVDVDESTFLEITADNFRDSTFVKSGGMMVKQAKEDPSSNVEELPAFIFYVAAIVSVAIIIYAARRK